MHSVIVGSGPAAAAAVLALESDIAHQITVVDIGERLDEPAAAAVARLAGEPPERWDTGDRELISAQPAKLADAALPEKRTFGSDYPFADRGQQRGLAVPSGGNTAPVSGALGGFSNVWGAQLMPFSPATFTRWPFGWSEIEPHYRAVLGEVPLAGEDDDYARAIPLLEPRAPLPPVAARSRAVLARYARHRAAINAAGTIVGKARLAFAAADCVRCGLCMTGCPYELIYSARHTIDRFVRSGRVKYLDRILVTSVEQPPDGSPSVHGTDLGTGRQVTVDADRVFLAAGGLGTTRIVLNSLTRRPQRLDLNESMQFLVPFVSRRNTGDPRAEDAFTLNQVNLLLEFDDEAYTTSQIHLYPYNPAFADALPRMLPRALHRAVLGRVTAGLGYLPSWESPELRLEVGPPREAGLPDVAIRRVSDERPPMLRAVLRRLAKLGPKLDLHPVLPMVRRSGPGKSYHFGGTFAHGSGSDLLGRVGDWPDVHLLDGSVLPSIPSTTFTFTVMAKAHRIATEAGHG
ncbi:MAG TPA: hypothetical protein VGH30_06855 [Jatrophihabitantaceae bacterium]